MQEPRKSYLGDEREETEVNNLSKFRKLQLRTLAWNKQKKVTKGIKYSRLKRTGCRQLKKENYRTRECW